MKRILSIVLSLLLVGAVDSYAQGGLLQKAANAAKKVAGEVTGQTTTGSSDAKSSVQAAAGAVKAAAPAKKSNAVYYVSAEGSNRADGLTPDKPFKDIQKALDAIADAGQNGATVKVAEGNYLGYLDAGYISVKNFITLEGGYNSDFSARDPFKYITRMQPTEAQLGTNGTRALISITGLDDTSYKNNGTLTIDGFMMDFGLENAYMPYDPSDPKTGSPEGVDTGRMIDDGSKQLQHQIVWCEGAIAGDVVICNCLFLNSPYFGLQINTRCGNIEVCNCVFVSNRYSAVRIDGWDKEGYRSNVNFHHNTVAFSWCRDKLMEDMGYGYEFMSKVNGDVHHNIFLCNNYAAVARTHALSGPDAAIEAKRVTDLHDNYFFMNAADLQLPSKGGGKWTNVMVKQFDDVSEKTIPNIDGNKELPADDPVVGLLWDKYLEGFSNIEIIESSSSFDPNSAANLYRQAHGMNMQGTEINRVSMYGNRYRFDEAMKLFGAKKGYGAQK